jgi:hypothetical protein
MKSLHLLALALLLSVASFAQLQLGPGGQVVLGPTGTVAPGVASINGGVGAFTFGGGGVSCVGTTCTFGGGTFDPTNPGPIGGGTPSTGAFTNVTASGSVAVDTAVSSPSYTGAGVAVSAQMNWASITAWGDSLTADTGVHSYPAQLQQQTGLAVYNGGVGGQTSTQIAARCVAATDKYGEFTVIWAGRNNYAAQSTVLADIASCVAVLPTPKRCLVLSITNANIPNEYSGQTNYNQIISDNTALAAIYTGGPSTCGYLDIRSYIVGQYNAGNAADVIDHGHDVPPFSLRGVDLGGTVASTILAGDTSISLNVVAPSGAPYANAILTLGTEYLYVTAVSGTGPYTCTVTRGYASTTPAGYSSGVAWVGTDYIHWGNTAYGLVATQISNWITAHDTPPSGLMNVAYTKQLFSAPPPMGTSLPIPWTLTNYGVVGNWQSWTSSNTPPAFGTWPDGVSAGKISYFNVVGDPLITSFTGLRHFGLAIAGVSSNSDWEGIDFLNSYATNGWVKYPTASIGVQNTGGGSVMHFGLSTNYANGITIDAMQLDQNGALTVVQKVVAPYFNGGLKIDSGVNHGTAAGVFSIGASGGAATSTSLGYPGSYIQMISASDGSNPGQMALQYGDASAGNGHFIVRHFDGTTTLSALDCGSTVFCTFGQQVNAPAFGATGSGFVLYPSSGVGYTYIAGFSGSSANHNTLRVPDNGGTTNYLGLGLNLPSGAPTYTAGTNVTSCVQATGYTNTNTRGELTIVGGTATTGTICTVTFSAALSAAPGLCTVTQNGGAALYNVGHGTASTTAFTVTAGASVSGATLTVDYNCLP